MKLKKLPAMKKKRRYLVFELVSDGSVTYTDMKNAVFNSLLNFLGEDGMSEADVRIIKNLWNQKNQSGFIQCSHRYVDKVKVALGLIHQIGESKVIFNVKKVAGTIKSGKKG